MRQKIIFNAILIPYINDKNTDTDNDNWLDII